MFRSIATKISLSFITLLLIFSLLFGYVLYKVAMNIINEHVLVQFSETLNIKIDELVNKVDQNLVERAKSSTEGYMELKKILEDFQEKRNTSNTFVLVKEENQEYILAAAHLEEYKTPYPFIAEMVQALKMKTESDIYDDEFGVFKSIFSPIPDTNAIVGIDLDASFIKELRTFVVKTAVLLSLGTVVVGLAISITISRQLTRPLHRLGKYVGKVAKGDFSERVPNIKNKDEVGLLAENIGYMVEDLKGLIGHLVENVGTSSKEVANASDEVKKSISETDSSIQSISKAIQHVANDLDVQVKHLETMNEYSLDISKAVEQVSGGLALATERAIKAEKLSDDGKQAVNKVVQSIQMIDKHVGGSQQVVARLKEHSKEVEEIITFITAITQQTNLLALNASIEAARAGQSGHGFAVVANEIRNLAEQSGISAQKISQKISTVQEDSELAVEAMSKGFEAVQEGLTAVEHAGVSFTEIDKAVNGVATQTVELKHTFEHIHDRIHSLAQMIQQIVELSVNYSENIQQVSAATEEQTAMIEEINYAVELLAEMATSLENEIATFNLTEKS